MRAAGSAYPTGKLSRLLALGRALGAADVGHGEAAAFILDDLTAGQREPVEKADPMVAAGKVDSRGALAVDLSAPAGQTRSVIHARRPA